MNLPKEYVNVMITYQGSVRVRDKYYDHQEERIVTRRAFYCKSEGYYNTKDEFIKTPNGYYSVPQHWTWHTWSDGTSSLTPQGFYHYPRVLPEDVISWELDKVKHK